MQAPFSLVCRQAHMHCTHTHTYTHNHKHTHTHTHTDFLFLYVTRDCSCLDPPIRCKAMRGVMVWKVSVCTSVCVTGVVVWKVSVCVTGVMVWKVSVCDRTDGVKGV